MFFCNCSRSLVRLPPVEPRQFHRAINRLRAAVRKKDAVHAGPTGKFARQRALVGVMKEIREVNRTPGFATYHFHDSRMRVAERVYGDAAKKIQIFFPSGIENVRAAAMCHDHRRALIGRQKELLGLQQASIRPSRFRRLTFDPPNRTRRQLLF